MRRWWADLGLLYAAAVWGSTFFLVKEAVEHIPPVTMVGWRFGLGALILLPALVHFLIPVEKYRKHEVDADRLALETGQQVA